MKAIIENNNTYEITGERGDFHITKDNKGKLKMFAKHLVEVVEIDEMPKAKVYKQAKPLTAEQAAKRNKSYEYFKRDMEFARLNEIYVDSEVARRMRNF